MFRFILLFLFKLSFIKRRIHNSTRYVESAITDVPSAETNGGTFLAVCHGLRTKTSIGRELLDRFIKGKLFLNNKFAASLSTRKKVARLKIYP